MACKICDDKKEGLEWTKNLISGKVRPIDVALHYGMDINEVIDHKENHDINTALVHVQKFSEKIQDPDYLYDKVGDIINRIEKWIDLTIDMNDDDPRTIDRGTKLIKEMRETLKLVFELEGKFNKGDTYHQQFIQIQGDYNQFTGMVLDTACPSCQKKIMEKIHNLKRLG